MILFSRPYGTQLLKTRMIPSNKLLGYCQLSLRDTQIYS